MSDEKYTTEAYRWVVLLLFMFTTIMNQMNWITFAPMMNDVAELYGVSPDTILYLLTASFMIVYVFMNYPATWAIDKYGLKWGTGIGVIFTGVFGLLRAFSPNFAVLAFAQIMIGVGQPFLLNSFTKVAIIGSPRTRRQQLQELAQWPYLLELCWECLSHQCCSMIRDWIIYLFKF